MTVAPDLAAVYLPVTTPLRDWLREHFSSLGTDANGTKMAYAAGLPTAAYADEVLRGTAVTLYSAGGLDGGTGMDRPFVRFNVFNESASTAETAANALRTLLVGTAPGTRLGLAASPANVRLEGAEAPAPIWSPDDDTRTPRFIVTSTLTVQAVST